MGEIANTLNASVTSQQLADAIPHVGPLFAALIIFSIGLVIFRRVLRGAKNAQPKM